MDRVLQVENLKVSYHSSGEEVQAVRGVSFYLDKGETLAIVGESGCGKSVTAKAIVRLTDHNLGEIKKGCKVIVDGEDILSMSEKELRNIRGSKIGVIFQDSLTCLNPTMKIGKQIAESLIFHKGMNKKEAFEEGIKMLEKVNIANAKERANQYPHEFSGGMRQRVMIAIALSCSPKILIADEPTTALDVTIQSQIIELIKNMQNEFQTSVILITHDLGVAADLAHRIQVMYAGKIVESGTVNEIFYDAKHPYTWALLQSIPKLDTSHKGPLYSLEGSPPNLTNPPEGCAFSLRCKYCMEICKEEPPEETSLSENHKVLCWLNHPYAPKVKNPIEKEGGAYELL